MFKHFYLITAIGLSLLLLLMYYMGCNATGDFTGREYMPDMGHSKAYEIYVPARTVVIGGDTVSLSKDGKAAFLPVEGTVARGFMPYHYEDTNEGYEAAGVSYKSPISDAQLNALSQGKAAYTKFLANGKANYLTYCAVCHDKSGKGQGTIVKNDKYPTPGSYFDKLDLTEGKMFHSIHYGKNLMGSYASQLTKEERWEVIAYIKDMQANHIAKDKKVSKELALKSIIGDYTYNGTLDGYAAVTAGSGLSVADFEGVELKESELDKIDKPLESGQTIALNNVFFGSGTSTLRKVSQLELDKLVQLLATNSGTKIEIGGHTDNTGNAAANLKLSDQRAKVVYDYLLAQGVATDAMTFKGYGSSKPVGDNATDEGKAANRRTEFTVL